MSDEPDESPRDRTLTWWPFAGAVVVGAIVLAVVLTVGSDGDGGAGTQRDANGALVCPATVAGDDSVPADPSGADGRKSLLPDGTPDHVTVCRYRTPAARSSTGKLAGHRTLTGGLSAMAKQLSGLPSAGDASPRETSTDPRTIYLLGVTYPTGFVWVAVEKDQTIGATNGQFATKSGVFAPVDQAYRTGTWTS